MREVRDRLGLSRESLGQRMGVRGHSIYRWERGTAEPTAENARAAAEALGVSVDWLMGEPMGNEPTPDYPAWAAFMTSREAADLRPHELATLASIQWHGVQPTTVALTMVLSAIRMCPAA